MKRLSEAEKNTPLPNDAGALLAELERSKLSPKAMEDLRAYARFYMWAIPLFDLHHVKVAKRAVEFDYLVAKRFMLSVDPIKEDGSQGNPVINVQTPEMNWMAHMPWAYAGIHFKSGRILLVCRPEKPLASSGFSIPIDVPEKLDIFRGKRFVSIREIDLSDRQFSGRKLTLEIKELDEGFFTKKKLKNKMA